MPSRVLGNRASAQYSRCSKSARRARATPPSSLRWRASRRRAYSAARGASCFVPVYALTHIYSVAYTKGMGSPFAIIAEPNRRAILGLLVSSQQSVGEIERRLRMPQPTVSKHLRVLREAGFVESTVDAQRRLDRKSTRLNSSHLGISYAVFCLKKKTQDAAPPRPAVNC